MISSWPRRHNSMTSIKARWTKLGASETLKHFSHAFSRVGTDVFVFGGDSSLGKHETSTHTSPKSLQARNQRSTWSHSSLEMRLLPVSALPQHHSMAKPTFFSGRGGEAMAPMNEKISHWELDTKTVSWTGIVASIDTYPEARYYHAMTDDT